ncbi:hypothetical protein [Streptomyces sp. XY332]|nr:hypothetical protein [Streptomyces sp. XY332]KOY53566.1 hypothetical protein ADK59_35045 [Streptomyces sp. XY332]
MRGSAAGLLQTAREISAALGLAVMGAIVANVQGVRLSQILRRDGRMPADRFDQVERSIGKTVAATQQGSPLPAGIPADLVPALKAAVTTAVSAAFYAGAAVLVTAAAAVALLPGKAEFSGSGRGQDDPA